MADKEQHSKLVQLGQPQQKRYNAVNINKKFIEKNAQSSAVPAPVIKNTAQSVRPQVQATTSHSKLVTAKLTAVQSSSSTSGWSRPSSATPPSDGISPTTASNPQPQVAQSQSKDKPVWGNPRAMQLQRSDLAPKDEFPTAAEVKSRLSEREAVLAAHAQARLEQADTFRGLHLDPNAHHWDEMEEDDDNFLNGVIEFGDGRQYKIESTQSPPESLQLDEETAPVSKEERFADDFDRSWPRSRNSPRLEFASSTTTGSVSLEEQARVLFNERSNKLEPYSKSATFKRDGVQKESRGRGARRDSNTSIPTLRPSPSETRGRRTNMGPPPVPPPKPPRQPSQSPALSHASLTLTAVSPVEPATTLTVGTSPISPTVDLDTLRKDLMHDAAARAKQRRLEEEEERERQKERARKKAAELEAKMEQEKEHAQEVIDIIEDAVNSVMDDSQELRRSLRRPRSLNGGSFSDQSVSSRRPSVSSVTIPTVQSAATSAESWRSKPSSLPSAAPVRRPSTASFIPPPPSVLEQSLAEEPDAEIEVVDFMEMAKFVGVPDAPPPQPEPASVSPTKILASRPRPVASDFFDDRPTEKTLDDAGPWRSARVVASTEIKVEAVSETVSVSNQDMPPSIEHVTQVVIVPPSLVSPPSVQKTPRNQGFHKEASMSALDDAMSRIKGALDVMQATEKEHLAELSKSPAPKDRWIAPALRSRTIDAKPTESFVTGCDPPWSPQAWNAFVVSLPKLSVPIDPLPGIKQSLDKSFPFRWDILSFEPNVEGMSKRDLSLNDVLFPKIGARRKPNKYVVSLPRVRGHLPKVNIPPTSKLNGVGAFGKSTAADSASTWRKSSPITPKLDSQASLDITSRSPPPEAAGEANLASIPDSSSTTSLRRTQPKMPPGSSVAFYRDSKVVEDGPMPLVSFIVTSELDESKKPQSNPASSPAASSFSSVSQASSSTTKTSPSLVNGVKSSLPSGFLSTPLSPSSKSDKKSDDSGELPSSHRSWARSSIKESPSRGPDPEHLKAVWSQTSNKTDSNLVNSLEAIQDDLTGIPFTLQDVKSEHGATPPPTNPAPPSRMSLHDVTRAFQQVPSSSASSSSNNATSLRPTISPPSTTAPVARPPTYTYPNQNMRPAYSPYPPMMSHTPSPIMYPSPIPNRMAVNGHAPMYAPQVWMPMPTSSPQNAVGVMRPVPVPSPYPAQLVPYPSPGGQPMYMPPPPHNMQTQQQNGTQSRGRGMHSTMMSPVISHAVPHPGVPMYAGSPVLMHAGRVQPNVTGQTQHSQPQTTNQPHTYSIPPSTSFVRPAW